MTDKEQLKKATVTLDKAWKQFKEHSTHYNETAYEQAYSQWKKHVPARRRAGRKPGGESAALTSTLRAQAVRDRQKQGAANWDKVVEYIQQLRIEVRAQDLRTVPEPLKKLVNETEIVLTGLSIIHIQPDQDFVAISCLHDKQPILIFLPKADLELYFEEVLGTPKKLTIKDANLIVDGNMKIFTRIISGKYERGEHRPYLRYGKTFPRVDITIKDLKKLTEKISADVLNKRQTFLI